MHYGSLEYHQIIIGQIATKFAPLVRLGFLLSRPATACRIYMSRLYLIYNLTKISYTGQSGYGSRF